MMNFQVSHFILVVYLCYASADFRVSSVQEVNKLTEDDGDGIWIKKHTEGLLNAEAGSKDTLSSSSEPPITASPSPVPDEKGDWMLNYTSSAVCSRLVAEIKLKFGYTKTNNESEFREIHIPKTAVASGNCTAGTMILSWPSPVNGTKKNDSLDFFFSLDNATQIWKVVNISGTVMLSVSSNSSKPVPMQMSFYNNDTSPFYAHVGMSYLCLKSNNTYNLVPTQTTHNGVNITSASITFSQLQVEAFKPNSTADNSVFGSPNNCEVTPDMVPIAVGCALAGLVVIVLVAYLIAQRKPANPYRSV